MLLQDLSSAASFAVCELGENGVKNQCSPWLIIAQSCRVVMHETRELYLLEAVDALSKAMASPTAPVSWKEQLDLY